MTDDGQVSPSRRLLIQALALVAAVVVAFAVLARVTRSDPPSVLGAAQDVPGHVLLVPGYGGSTSALEVLAGKLRAAGRTAAVVPVPGNGTGDMAQSAAVVVEAVDAALAAGAPSVDLVGYSAGGVIVRYAVKELGAQTSVRRVVTLGSPHHGAKLAGVGAALAPGSCPAACRQLVPDGDFLDALNDGDETPDGPEWLSLWTEQDETVTPPDSARLDGAVNVVLQDVCPGIQVTHSELPRTPLVGGIVLTALSADPLTKPRGCDALVGRGS
jgi:triacylglycerol lipase